MQNVFFILWSLHDLILIGIIILKVFKDWKSSYSFLRTDDTTELMEEAARVALCSSQPNGVDSTQALLKTFAWVEPPEENTFCMVPSVPPHHNRERQLGSKVHENGQPAIEIIPGMWLNCCSFFIIMYLFFLLATLKLNCTAYATHFLYSLQHH